MKDLLIALSSNLKYDDLKPWIESFNEVNSTAEKSILLFNADSDTVKKVVENGFNIYSPSGQNGDGSFSYGSQIHMNVERFGHFWNFLRKKKSEYRYIIACDSRDMVFQKDPFEFLHSFFSDNPDKNFIASAEPIFYKDETFWGAQNFIHSFGEAAFDHVKDSMIYNAGTIAGRADYIIDLFCSIFFLSLNNRVPNPDQAAYNFLLSLEPYKSMTHFSSSQESWAAQIGVLMHPQFDSLRQEPKPIWKDGTLYTANNKEYCILHQYDRTREVVSFINQKFGVNINGY